MKVAPSSLPPRVRSRQSLRPASSGNSDAPQAPSTSPYSHSAGRDHRQSLKSENETGKTLAILVRSLAPLDVVASPRKSPAAHANYWLRLCVCVPRPPHVCVSSVGLAAAAAGWRRTREEEGALEREAPPGGLDSYSGYACTERSSLDLKSERETESGLCFPVGLIR